MSQKQSSGSPAASTMRSKSPLPAKHTMLMSLCSGLVGIPVLGPERWVSTMTSGISALPAWPIPSAISAIPGLDEPTRARTPVSAAPSAMFTEESSSSACHAIPPTLGRCCCRNSRMSVAGVIG